MIHRYVVRAGDPVKLWIGGNPLAVAVSGAWGDPDYGLEFWAETDLPEAAGSLRGRTHERTFLMVGTGHPIPDSARYWGTAARTPQGLVWHLYELEPRKYRSGEADQGGVKIHVT